MLELTAYCIFYFRARQRQGIYLDIQCKNCGAVAVMVFNTNLNNISVISWRPIYWRRKSEYPEKTTDLSQVSDKLLSHNVSSSTPQHEQDSNWKL